MAYDVCTPKQELFAQEVAKAEDLTEAHRIAYPNNMTDKQRWETASNLLKIPKVFQRVQELKAETAKATGLTREWIVEQARDVLADTRASKEHGASVQALKLLTTLGGFDKQTLICFHRLDIQHINVYYLRQPIF